MLKGVFWGVRRVVLSMSLLLSYYTITPFLSDIFQCRFRIWKRHDSHCSAAVPKKSRTQNGGQIFSCSKVSMFLTGFCSGSQKWANVLKCVYYKKKSCLPSGWEWSSSQSVFSDNMLELRTLNIYLTNFQLKREIFTIAWLFIVLSSCLSLLWNFTSPLLTWIMFYWAAKYQTGPQPSTGS